MTHEILRIEGMNVDLSDKTCLKNVDFNLFENELIAVTGLNNSGKTVLAAAIAGMIPFTADRILRDECELPSWGEYSRATSDIFYISRESQLIDGFTIAENIFGFQRHFSLSVFNDRSANEQTAEMLRRLGLGFTPTLRTEELSSAQKHLVTICRAVALGARIIILDSISNQYNGEEFERLADTLRRLKGISVIYVSHNSDPVLMIADRVTVIRDSTIIAVLYKDCFEPEQLAGTNDGAFEGSRAANLSWERDSLPVLSFKYEAGGRTSVIELHRGEILVLQDSRDGTRHELVERFLSGAAEAALGGASVPSYRQAVKNGLGVIPEALFGKSLFKSLDDGDNLAFQVMKKASMLGFLKPRMIKYIRRKYAAELSDEACRGSGAWHDYKLLLYRWRLSNCRALILEDPATNMDGIILQELLSVLDEFANSGMGIMIISNSCDNYAGICGRVLDIEHGVAGVSS